MLIDGQPRRILLISPQPWAGIQVSKHHYARALAKLGHQVDFVEPPIRRGRAGQLTVAAADGEARIRIVRYRPWFPYSIKFHARPLFDLAMRRQAQMIAAATGHPDIVWDFDNNYQFNDLRAFGAPVRIMHLVDQVGARQSGVRHADLVVALDQDFIERVGARSVPHLVVAHGLNPVHAALARRIADAPQPKPRSPGAALRIGYVGNLMMASVDHAAILLAVEANPAVAFDFVSPVGPETAGTGPEADWLRRLAASTNVTIHTGFGPREIVALADTVDAWMVCYDLARDINAGANSHKMLEYLATGSPVLTSWLRPYVGSALVTMAPRGDNSGFPDLLTQMLGNMAALDRADLRKERAAFALRHDYADHVETISAALDTLHTHRAAA